MYTLRFVYYICIYVYMYICVYEVKPIEKMEEELHRLGDQLGVELNSGGM